MYTRCDQKVNVVSNNYIVSSKLYYNYSCRPSLMPAFFPIIETLLKRAFWYRQQLLFRFIFYLLKRSKTLSFHRCLQFWEEKKVSGGRVRSEYGG